MQSKILFSFTLSHYYDTNHHLMILSISLCAFLVSSKNNLLCSWVLFFFPPGASLFISLLICRNLAYNILQISHIFCPLATCLLSCLFCESLTRNLYFLVAKMIIFCFIFVFLVFFLKISFQDLAAKIFYDFFSINLLFYHFHLGL